MLLSFLEIKNSDNKLFRDYLYDYSKVRDFFSVNPHDADKIHIQNVISGDHDRRKLVEILTRQNTAFGNSPQALERIAELAGKNTVAVVTGQQAGFFGGPLYTIYKAIGAVKWCALCRERFPGYQFVPVFWIEAEDHDFEEVRSIALPTIENEIRKITYNGDDPDNILKNPVNRITIGPDVERVLAEIRSVLNPTDFSEGLLRGVQNAYTPGTSVTNAFGKWMASLLGSLGLILMDPSDPEFKKLARPVFKKELESAAAVHELLTRQSAALVSAGYAAQVETQPTNLFLLDPGSEKLPFNTTARSKFRLTPEDANTHREMLGKMLESTPERFVPNVVLRPIVQDFLLPTFAYVAGPSEIAYFAQFKTIYAHFGVTEPVIVPRPFVTLLEKKNKKVLDKYGVTLQDVFNNPGGIPDLVAAKNSAANTGALFDEFSATIKNGLSGIEQHITRVDPTLKGAAATASEKIAHALKVLQDKSADAEKRSLELTHSQLAKTLAHLYPNRNFQERELNALYYLNKYGTDLIDTLCRNIDPGAFEHRVIEL